MKEVIQIVNSDPVIDGQHLNIIACKFIDRSKTIDVFWAEMNSIHEMVAKLFCQIK